MWYVLQTMTGREEALVDFIKKIVPADLYADCFTPYHERVWRKQGQSVIHVERLFPGYVIIVTDEPDHLFLALKRVPAMSKLLSDGYYDFIPLEKEEEDFLDALMTEDRIIRLSYVEADRNGHVYRISGPLENYKERIVRYQFRKRYVLVCFQMLGVEKIASLGIILRDDVQQELAYGRVEAPVALPQFCEVQERGYEAEFIVGDRVRVTTGSMKDMTGIVWKIRKGIVEVGIHLFGQDVSVEVPIDELCLFS